MNVFVGERRDCLLCDRPFRWHGPTETEVLPVVYWPCSTSDHRVKQADIDKVMTEPEHR